MALFLKGDEPSFPGSLFRVLSREDLVKEFANDPGRSTFGKQTGLEKGGFARKNVITNRRNSY